MRTRFRLWSITYKVSSWSKRIDDGIEANSPSAATG